jgi:hypothetical protein
MYTHSNNRGSLFKNNRKTSETHPDYAGEININGELYFIDAWLKSGEQAGKWLALSIKRKDKQPLIGEEL